MPLKDFNGAFSDNYILAFIKSQADTLSHNRSNLIFFSFFPLFKRSNLIKFLSGF